MNSRYTALLFLLLMMIENFAVGKAFQYGTFTVVGLFCLWAILGFLFWPLFHMKK